MLSTVRKWGEFVKFSHTVFALPFALAAMVVAARENRGWPGWDKFLLILAAMVCARACAMSFNRIADRKFVDWCAVNCHDDCIQVFGVDQDGDLYTADLPITPDRPARSAMAVWDRSARRR